MIVRLCCVVAMLTLAGVVAVGMRPQDQPVFRANVRTVPVYATVIDVRGRLVPDLDKADFSVVDNGKPADVSLFSSDSQPFTAVVMLDTSASMVGSLELLKAAAEEFVARLLPVDRAQVGAFNDKIQLSGTFTNNRGELAAGLDELDFGNPTRLYDGIAASLDALAGIDGRRVVLVFTDGDDTASRASFKAVLDRAVNEEIMVYAIGLESEYFNGERVVRTRPSRDLKRIAEETGGGYFELTKSADLSPTFTRVAQELRSQYLLSFAPAALYGKTHKIEVRVSRTGMTVRARKSYVAARDSDKSGPVR